MHTLARRLAGQVIIRKCGQCARANTARTREKSFFLTPDKEKLKTTTTTITDGKSQLRAAERSARDLAAIFSNKVAKDGNPSRVRRSFVEVTLKRIRAATISAA